MLVTEENIPEFIPQRFPMLMADGLVACEKSSAVSQLKIRKDNFFLDKNGLTAAGIMEAMAQTAALRTGYLLKNQPEGVNKKIPVGVIGSIKNFRMGFQPSVNSVMTTTVYIEHEVLQASVVRAKAEVDGRLVAESNLQIFLTEE
jgi:3-hydroxymyristoyl/3-hydroxydecanoyl-(acyl carrier protein) dehydratase